MYVFRLDDASEYMDVEKWNRIEKIFDDYGIKPIVGIIPHNEDPQIVPKYQKNDGFWDKARLWKEKGWRIALHGYNHAFTTKEGGLNPINKKSEFAGVSYEIQRQKISDGYKILCDNNLKPDMFFAPAHTYDENTLKAIKEETKIRIISDTFANDTHFEDGFYYVPQQTGKLKNLPFKITTICFHPNKIKEERFAEIEQFMRKNRDKIIEANEIILKDRKMSIYDEMLRKIYLVTRKPEEWNG